MVEKLLLNQNLLIVHVLQRKRTRLVKVRIWKYDKFGSGIWENTKLNVKWWFLSIDCLLELSKVNDTEPQDLSDALETEKELENSTINPSSPSITSGTEFYKTTDKIAGNDSKTESVNKSSNLTEEKKDIKVFQMLGKIEFLSFANVKYKLILFKSSILFFEYQFYTFSGGVPHASRVIWDPEKYIDIDYKGKDISSKKKNRKDSFLGNEKKGIAFLLYEYKIYELKY